MTAWVRVSSRILPIPAVLAACLALVQSPAAGAPPSSGGDHDCLVEARQVVEIRSPVEGLIESIPVERGDLVRKGQLLVTLESGPEQAAVESARYRASMDGAVKSAEARVNFTQRKLERTDELFKKNFVSSTAKDEAETEHRLAENELRQALENRRLAELEHKRANELLKMRTIRSPFSGVVVERYMSPGEFATSNVKKPILKLAEIDPLNVEVILPAALYGSVRTGSKATVFVDETGSEGHVASVSIVDRVLDAASGTFGVRLSLPNADYRIPAGVKCKIRFAAQSRQ